VKIKRAHGSVELEYLRCGGSYLHSIEVDPDWQGRGYGSHLMKLALEKSRYPVYLLASSELGGDVDRLVKWYKRFGFVKKRGSDVGYNYNMVRWE
jgi:ribosomal protein S18 acetylase RimI-like enzyme